MELKLNWENLLSTKRLNGSSGATKDIRNAFESDYGRTIFSPAIRRMHDKTQVFPLSDDDNIHTRLTHSQEVMSIGYTFGVKLVNEIFNETNTNITREDFNFLKKDNEILDVTLQRTIPIILQTVCLVHDIGNTPFGHFGEDTISNFFEIFFNTKNKNEYQKIKEKYELSDEQILDFTEYDGNAQGLRVLTKLQILDNIYGLNLTSAVLASYLKYPNKSNKKRNTEIANKKHGIFYSEYVHFENIINNCGLEIESKVVRHPLCYLMEAADTIAYRTMDVEDGFNKGFYKVHEIIDILLKDIPKEDKLHKDLFDLKNNSSINEKVRMVKLRIRLIDYLVENAFNNYIKNYLSIMNGDYQKELLEEDDFKIDSNLGKICKKHIFDSNEVNSMEVTGNSVIVGLLNFYIEALIIRSNCLEKRAFNMISKSIINTSILDSNTTLQKQKSTDVSMFDFEDFKKLNVYYKLRVIVDFISGMTDQYALKHYQLISGLRLK